VDVLLGSKRELLNVPFVTDGRTLSSSQPHRYRVTANQDETILVLDLGLELSCDSWIVPGQEVSDDVPVKSVFASLMEERQTVFGVFVALLEL
jgi:hypothetical protein